MLCGQLVVHAVENLCKGNPLSYLKSIHIRHAKNMHVPLVQMLLQGLNEVYSNTSWRSTNRTARNVDHSILWPGWPREVDTVTCPGDPAAEPAADLPAPAMSGPAALQFKYTMAAPMSSAVTC